jgi:hypothetical protein
MPGWLPTEDLEQQARATAIEYMADLDSGKYAEAYSLIAELDRKDQPFSAFAERLRQFNARAGAVLERRIVTITWTKNPAHAPIPGVYVALDLVSRFANIDRHCGYLVLYQSSSGGTFQVMHEENNFIDNASAANIARQSSPQAVERAWVSLSSNCPGYQSSRSVQGQSSPIVPPTPIPEAPASTIEYPNVAAALTALHSKAGVVFKTQGGWTIAEDDSESTFWSFPPPGNPAFPSVVKRHFVATATGTTLEMKVQCESTKQACDELVRSFEALNSELGSSLRGHQ